MEQKKRNVYGEKKEKGTNSNSGGWFGSAKQARTKRMSQSEEITRGCCRVFTTFAEETSSNRLLGEKK